MVYNGVPSRGCYLCRSRKIKCDETKPFCNRCRKSKRQCPGYPVVTDTHTRPYTDVRKPTKEKKEDANEGSSSDNDEEYLARYLVAHTMHRLSNSPPIDSTIKIPLSDAASCHFLSKWVLIPPESTNRGIFGFFLPLHKKAAQGSPFYLAFKACSLSSLTHRGLDPVIQRQAASYYVKALAATSSALSRPSVATSDATLATVMLLALYEIQSATSGGGYGWGSHVAGSMQLMNSRSWKKLNTDIGMGIFVAVRVKLILLGMLTGTTVPTTSDWWGKGTFKDKYALVGLQLATQAVEVRNELNSLLDLECATLNDLNEVAALMERAQALEEQCRAWPETLPEYFRFYVAAWVNEMPQNLAEAQALPGPVHGYSGPWVAGVWNLRTDIQMLPEYHAAAQSCKEVVQEIISGAPYYLGWFKNRTSLLLTLPNFACGDNGMENSLSAFFIMFPMITLKNLEFATEDQRAWASGRVRYIAHHFGLKTALYAEPMDGMAPSTKIAEDYESRSARQWRHLTTALVAETSESDPSYCLASVPDGAAVNNPGHVGASMEIPIHPRVSLGNSTPSQGQRLRPC
ncbi:hypothetical protein NLG97_g3 [Lecanicillium saksenae]|uniref:Uncharacterized protein n=1 Tax=Lecanicillium saksenae TaxID=468837 RepID=A0ACC1R9N1_9HYPO|nr:hypothetical protein NLG97_g3 [Lecanicillium saksenae]